MPISAEHKKQKTKNYALLALLVGLVAILFCVGFIRVKIGQ